MASYIGTSGVVARIGSGTFAVLLSDFIASSEEIGRLQGIQKLLRQPMEGMGTKEVCNASIGVAVFPDNEPEPTELLKSADSAMLIAERVSPGGMIIFNSDMRRVVRQYMILEDNKEPGQGGNITPREQDVLSLIVQGLSSRNIAKRLGISMRTAEFHRANILQKFNAKNAAELTRMIFTNAGV